MRIVAMLSQLYEAHDGRSQPWVATHTFDISEPIQEVLDWAESMMTSYAKPGKYERMLYNNLTISIDGATLKQSRREEQ